MKNCRQISVGAGAREYAGGSRHARPAEWTAPVAQSEAWVAQGVAYLVRN